MSDKLFSEDSLFGRLSVNVANLMDKSSNPAVRVAIQAAAVDAFRLMEPDVLIDRVAPVIDSVDAKVLKAYWSANRFHTTDP